MVVAAEYLSIVFLLVIWRYERRSTALPSTVRRSSPGQASQLSQRGATIRTEPAASEVIR